MSEWRGISRPDEHMDADADGAYCARCGDDCDRDDPCRCCLAAEVERLTQVIDAHRGMGCKISSYDERAVLLSEVERLTALLKAADDVVASQDRRIDAAIEALGHELPESTGPRVEFAAGQNYLRANVLEALRGTDE